MSGFNFLSKGRQSCIYVGKVASLNEPTSNAFKCACKQYSTRKKNASFNTFSVFCFMSSAWGEIQFEEVSQQAGITRIGESWGNAWGDFDGDGYLDLWATNHKHKPSLYRNNGNAPSRTLLTRFGTRIRTQTHTVSPGRFR